MWCGVADESVVVMNPQPMKAGNRPEDRTEGTAGVAGLHRPKAYTVVKVRR
jgi:hypothetical protein